MADINLGDNYEIDEDSNGNLVIKDNADNIVLEHDHTASEWGLGNNPLTDVASVGDASNGDVYDGTNLTADVDNQSVSTGRLQNTADGGDWETLKLVGYEEGDYIPFGTFGPANGNAVNFTATNYTDDPNLSRVNIQWDSLVPNGDGGAATLVRVDPGTDESVDIRLYNITDSEVIAEQTGIAATGTIMVGFSSYTPSTTSAPIDLRAQWRTNPGTNQSTVQLPYVYVGPKI